MFILSHRLFRNCIDCQAGQTADYAICNPLSTIHNPFRIRVIAVAKMTDWVRFLLGPPDGRRVGQESRRDGSMDEDWDFKRLFERRRGKPTAFETVYRPKWMLNAGVGTDFAESDIETEFALSKGRHEKAMHDIQPAYANFFCPQCNLADVMEQPQKQRLEELNSRQFDLNALTETDPLQKEFDNGTDSFDAETANRPRVEERQATWGEIWWADMPPDPPMAETLFHERMQSLEMTRIMEPGRMSTYELSKTV
jgi:hypothetical protein